jgi:hypothetical protein
MYKQTREWENPVRWVWFHRNSMDLYAHKVNSKVIISSLYSYRYSPECLEDTERAEGIECDFSLSSSGT